MRPAVVNFSSTSANFAHPYMSAYAASKAGVQAMTHALALEFSKEGIRFNSRPAGIDLLRNDRGHRGIQAERRPRPARGRRLFAVREVHADTAARRRRHLRKPDAVAAVVAMLGAAEAYFITGTEVRIDGGTHL